MTIIEHTYKNKKNQRIVFTKSLTKKTEIILHCSATPINRDYTVDTINLWHLNRGFDGIGYHYVVYRDGSVHKGRPDDCAGAHCVGHNSKGIGICYIGGLGEDGKPKDTRTEAQRISMHQLVEYLRKKYGNLALHCHNEFAKKACPSFKLSQF